MREEQAVRGAQSVYRTAEILELLLTSPMGLTARDVALQTQLPLSTTHRILMVLCEKKLIRQESNTHNYVAGHMWISEILWGRQLFLHNLCAELPFYLVKEFGYTAYLHCRIGYSYQCLVRAEGEGSVQVFSSYQGEVRYLGDGAGSFGILAFLDKRERNAILKTNLPLFRKNLLRDETDLYIALDDAAVSGYAFGKDFRVAGTSALAMPLRHKSEVIGSLSISGMYDDEWLHQQDAMIASMKAKIAERDL